MDQNKLWLFRVQVVFRLLSFVIDFIKIYSELWTTVQTESENYKNLFLN